MPATCSYALSLPEVCPVGQQDRGEVRVSDWGGVRGSGWVGV